VGGSLDVGGHALVGSMPLMNHRPFIRAIIVVHIVEFVLWLVVAIGLVLAIDVLVSRANADCSNPADYRSECAIQQDVLEQAAHRACAAQLGTAASEERIQKCVEATLEEGDE
jgi:hypothetical protein